MVNTGKPSQGCLTCRRRRVKCDEGKPDCNRCIKLKIDCEWKDEWSSMLRRQEKWAAKKVVQRVERVQKKRDLEERRTQSASPAPSQPRPFLVNAVSLPSQPQIGPEVFAINLFYSDYSFTAASCPFLYLVQPLYMREDSPSCLHSIVPAVALASAAKQQRRHDLMAAAHEHYGTALRKLVHCLADPEIAKQDATLITVFLLGLYEFISADCFPDKPAPYLTHGPGRLALLRLRGRDQFNSRDGRNIFIILYHEQLISSLLGNGEPLDESPFWLHDACDLSPIVSLQLLMHDITCFVTRCRTGLKQWKSKSVLFTSLLRTGLSLSKLASSMLDLFQSESTIENDTMKYYAQADARRVYAPTNVNRGRSTSPPQERFPNADMLEQDVKNRCLLIWWPRNVPVAKVSVSLKDSSNTASEVNAEVSFYLNVTRALASNLTRALHLHLLKALLDILPHVSSAEAMPTEYGGELNLYAAEWQASVQQNVIDICNDIPSALGEVDHTGRRLATPLSGSSFRAYLQLFPLLTALEASRDFPAGHKLTTERLKYIGDIVGIGMANQMANMANIPEASRGDSPRSDAESGRTPRASPTPQQAFSPLATSMDSHVYPANIAIR
ncbi:hypothetical protein BDV96DRAFT_229807 [Lophiotrema nucula]|uniref:Zn(2)-C6 fungal-type domain-containing protein n=1 Tax=Lophiotrema nucula TaxID=690887 RepID=A0A6A5YSA1_9PLEO|nr:hypothetical protein BDV96DRAFT_229807 [Lophiotrema nucula]